LKQKTKILSWPSFCLSAGFVVACFGSEKAANN
jgi:hypothetical protein